jgi:succinylglutamate desuccinylase
VVARRRAEAAGPTVLLIAGMHGNEPAGLSAAQRVLAKLDASAGVQRGELVVLAGNCGAIARGVRFVQRDLNRQWSDERVLRLREDAANPAVALGPEDREQLELVNAIDAVLAEARGEVFVVDLHTTSADGIPFAMIGERLKHRSFALQFPLPLLLGLLGQIEGTLLEYLSARGCVTIGVEGGQHAAERSVAHHEAVLWIALAAAGLVPEGFPNDLAAQRDRLARAGRDLPHALRVNHRHAITPADRFIMQPGFANLQRVTRGTLLGRDVRGEIKAKRDAILVMPLYQKLGDDGFFLGAEIPEPLFKLGAWWGKLFAVLAVAATMALAHAPNTPAATSTTSAPSNIGQLAIFRCMPQAHGLLFPGATLARVVLDSRSYFTAVSARDLAAGLSLRSETEFELISGSESVGASNPGEVRTAPDGSGFAFAWLPRSSSVRVALCELRNGLPTGVTGMVTIRPRDALLIKMTLAGVPCVGVMRVFPMDASGGKDPENAQAVQNARDAFEQSVDALYRKSIVVSNGEASPAIKKFLASIH